MQIVGWSARPNATFVKQAALEWIGFDDGFLRGCSHLITDRDQKYTAEFEEILRDQGVKLIRIPPRSPNRVRTRSGSFARQSLSASNG